LGKSLTSVKHVHEHLLTAKQKDYRPKGREVLQKALNAFAEKRNRGMSPEVG